MSTPLSDADFKEIAEAGTHFAAEFLLREEAPSTAQLKKAKKWIPGEIAEESIIVWPVLAIDTAPTRNNVIYSEESQKKSLKRWVGITFLFNALGSQGAWDNGPDHKLQAASQVARIFDAKLVKTPKGEVGTLLWVYSVKGTDPQTEAFINKVEAGILREVSIHVSLPPDQIVCSIDKLGFYEHDEKNRHYPGETYGGKACYMETTGLFTPLELSAVACPGSVNAHFMDDDETSDYPPVPLREALGGSAQMQEIIMAQTAVTEKTAEELAEEIRAAGATLAESVMPGVETKTTTDGDDDGPDASEDDGEETKKKKKEALETTKGLALFEGHCPACKRDGKTEESSVDEAAIRESAIADFRTEVEARISEITEQASAKVAEADARAEAAQKLVGDGAALTELFKDFIKETVDIAISKGVKSEDARDTYATELASLSYQGVKAVREALDANTGTSQRETARQALTETAKERATKDFGTTNTRTNADGRTKTVDKPRGFTTKIGPK